MLSGAWRRALVRQGVAAGVEHLNILRFMGEVRTVVDVGANKGQFALTARECFPDAQIFSFEPLPGAAQVFRKVFGDDQSVKLFDVAIGPQSGVTDIHVSERDDSSSLLQITSLQNQLFPGTAEADTCTVKVARLADKLDASDIKPPSLLKLDVQGFELPALLACVDFICCFQWVYVECSFVELYKDQALADKVVSWLEQHGFRFCGIYNAAYDVEGRAIQGDFLFERR